MKTKQTLKTIRAIAKDVREQCEKFVFSSRSSEYHFGASLDCMCAIASYALYMELQKKGIDTQFIEGTWHEDSTDRWGYNHCWIEWHQYIIDITATQFGVRRRVCINQNRDNTYKGKRAVKRPSRMISWPANQRPSDTMNEKIMACR